MEPRHTARGIVVHEGKILLMERWRDDLHYFSIPGGGIEAGEAPEQTVVREILEEMTIQVSVERLVLTLIDGPLLHQIYLCNYISGEPVLPPEAPEQFTGPNNRFEPKWVDVNLLADISLGYWEPLHNAVLAGVFGGFPDVPVQLTMPA